MLSFVPVPKGKQSNPPVVHCKFFHKDPYQHVRTITIEHKTTEANALYPPLTNSTIHVVDMFTRSTAEEKEQTIEKLLVLDCDETLARIDEYLFNIKTMLSLGTSWPEDFLPELIFPNEIKEELTKARLAKNVKVVVMTARPFDEGQIKISKTPIGVINILNRIGLFFESIYYVGDLSKAIVINHLHKQLFNTQEPGHASRTLLIDDNKNHCRATEKLGHQVARVSSPPTKIHIEHLRRFIATPIKNYLINSPTSVESQRSSLGR